MENLKELLIEGNEVIFENFDEYIAAECKFIKGEKNPFQIIFNGKLLTFKTFKTFNKKLKQLIIDFNLS